MAIAGAKKVGRFTIKFEVANNDDLAQARHDKLDPAKVRRLRIDGVVDRGASKLVLPGKVAKELGLPVKGKVKVRYADRRRALRDEVEAVYVEIMGRHNVFSAIVEPKRRNALIGAIILEDLDFLVDSRRTRLVPRDPRFVVSELE